MTEFQRSLGKFMHEYAEGHDIVRLDAVTDLMKLVCAITESDTALLMLDKGGKLLSIVEGNDTALSPRRLRVTLESMQQCLQEIVDHTDSSTSEAATRNHAYVRDEAGGGFTEDDSLLPGQS